MPQQINGRTNSFHYQEGILLIVGFLVVSLTFAAFVGLVNLFTATIALPMLSIAGIILLLLFLAGISYVFVRTGLQDRSQALGMPPGSIQAVIALSLIVLFAILSIFVFTSTGSQFRRLTVSTPDERDRQIGQLGPSFGGWEQAWDGRFTIFVREPASDTRDDIGKQLIVLIGTLMTSAVSFYFGSRATAAGAAATSPDTPRDTRVEAAAVITRIEPVAAIHKGQPSQVTIFGVGLSEATAVTFKHGEHVLEGASLTKTDTGLVCTVTPSPASPTGSYDVTITVAGKEVTRPAGLTIQ
jgi:hypothetical protein